MNIKPPSINQLPKQAEEPLSPESLHTLKILDEVASGRSLTQRDLSKKLGIALGMTNNYLKRLARHGYIQIQQTGRRRLHYLLTPKGIAEKSALTYRYIQRSYQFFTEARQKIGGFFEMLEKDGVRSIILYKVTVMTEIAVLVLQDTGMNLVAIVDDDRAGERFLGSIIEPVKALSDLRFDRILITTEEPVDQVELCLAPYGVGREKICALQ